MKLKLTLLCFDAHDGKTIELPPTVTAPDQVKVLSFDSGNLWVAILEPSGAISEDQTPP